MTTKRVEVRAAMSGVFYRKPAPDQPSYVEIGDTVKKKQVLGLLETMKVFQLNTLFVFLKILLFLYVTFHVQIAKWIMLQALSVSLSIALKDLLLCNCVRILLIIIRFCFNHRCKALKNTCLVSGRFSQDGNLLKRLNFSRKFTSSSRMLYLCLFLMIMDLITSMLVIPR